MQWPVYSNHGGKSHTLRAKCSQVGGELNNHELRYKRSTRWLIALGVTWIGAMLLFALLDRLLPKSYSKSETTSLLFAVVVSTLFAVIFVVSVITYVSYVRWTGKYPYYFLFKRSVRHSGNSGESADHDS